MNKFDKYGRRLNPNYQHKPVSSFISTYLSSRSRSRNIWRRANGFITNIGSWIEDNRDALAYNLTVGFLGLVLLGLLSALIIDTISEWINHGFWSAFWSVVFRVIIIGVVLYFTSEFLFLIFYYILRIFFFVSRYILYNIYTLLIFIMIVTGICVLK